MSIAATAEQRAMATSVGQWAKRAGTIAAVRDLETTGGRTGGEPWAAASWAALAGLGVFSIGLPEAAGGAGGSAADVAVVAEQLAAWLVPGPVLPTLLAGLLLAGQPGQQTIAAEIGSGAASVAVAWPAGGLTARRAGAGLRVTGTASLVLGAGDTTHLLLAAATGPGQTWFLTRAGEAGVQLVQRAPVDFSRAIADVTVSGLLVGPDQVLTGLGPGLVVDLAAVLAAAEASGIAGWCTAAAAGYARTRQQFGRPIGSFQAVKHLCAGLLCRSELATAIAWDAACAVDQAPDELPLAAAAAAAVALDAAVDNAKDAIQVLGGIGFTWEHDAHLYLRRALALRQLLGGSAAWRARAAGLAIGGRRRHRPGAGSPSPVRTSGQNEIVPADEIRKAARLVATAVSAVPPERRRKALAEVGYIAPGWPRPYGLAASPAEQLVIDEELAAAGITRPEIAIGGWAIPAIASHGTPEQLGRFAEPTLRGDIVWCQLFSEPEAGSDLASLRTKAVRADGGWRLTGQKVWTSLAGQADWAICLARTDPAVPKHKGISYFLVSMRDPGIEVRPLREITGRRMFNEVFLDDVFVPDDCVVGQPGDGWRIARTTLATERVAMVRGAGLSKELEDLLAVCARGDGPPGTPAGGAPGVSDPPVPDPPVPDSPVPDQVGLDQVGLDQVGARLAEALALSAMDDRLAGEVTSGAGPGSGSGGAGSGAAVRKLLGVAHRQSVAETALTLCGAGGAAADGEAEAAVHEFLLTRCLSIAGGTSQILLTLVAERVLGLPRQEAPADGLRTR